MIRPCRRAAVWFLEVLVVAAGLTACGGGESAIGPSDTTTSSSTSTSATTPSGERAQPPGGSIGIPTAKPTDTLGIPGVEAVKLPDRCAIKVTATTDALGFVVNRSDITPQGQNVLRRIAQKLQGATSAAISGHASVDGRPERNITLAAERAASVRAFLEPLLPGTKLTDEGFGSSRPKEPGDAPEALAANRRVEIEAEVPEEVCTTFAL